MARRTWGGATLPILLLVLVACGSQAGPAPTAGPTGAGGAAPGEQPLPSSLSFTPEATAAGEATVSYAEGGTITATALDGTVFRLEVPPMAVAEDVAIRATPLDAVRGITHDQARAIHAVQLEPEGLVFLVPARLTIMPATPIAPADELAFEANGDGTDPRPALVDPRGSAIVLVVEHFTVEGVASVTPEQRRLFRAKSAATAKERLGRRFRDLLQDGRNGAPPPSDALDAVADEYQREVLDKLRANAAESCAGAQGYLREVISWERQRQLGGLDRAREAASQERVAQAVSFVQDRYDTCEREAIARCRAEKRAAILVEFWVAWGRERDAGMAERARRRCEGGDFRIDKTVTGSAGNATWSIRYSGTKCGGPAGTWTIDSTGGMRGGGGTADIGGPITVELEESGLTGTLEGVANFRSEFDMTQGFFTGTARFVESPATLELTVTGGRGRGYSYGFLDTGVMQPGTLTFPLEEGRFCD